MSMSYNEALNQYKSGFDEKSWKKHERNKKKLKSFAKVKFVGKSLYPIENLKAPNDVFMKRFKLTNPSVILTLFITSIMDS